MSGAAERVVRALDRHWFAPADLRDLAAVRIVLIGLFLGTMLAPELSGVLGITGGYGFEAQRWFLEIPDESFAPIPMLKLLTVPFGAWGARPGPLLLHTIGWVALASGIMALVGVFCRTSMLVFAAATTLLIAHGYSYGELHHPQTLPVLALWVLPFAPIGGACAVDALRGRIRRARRDLEFAPVRHVDRTHPFARWPIRTIQWLLVLAYLSAGLSKLEIGGLEWLNGYRILRHLAERAMTGSELAGFVGGLPLIATALAVVTVLFELTFAAAVVVPRLTLLYMITGTLLHVGIFVLIGAPFVGWPLLYVVLLENVRRGRSGARRAGSRGAATRQAPRQADAPDAEGAPDAEVTPHADVAPDTEEAPNERARWTVYYDDLCPLCIRSMVVVDALDLGRRLAYVGIEEEVREAAEPETRHERGVRARTAGERVAPEALRHAMHVVDPEGRVYRGFFAFRALARALPPLWPVLPLLHLPGVASLGVRVYDRVARARGRGACRARTCRA